MAADPNTTLDTAIYLSLFCSLVTGLCVHYLTKDRDTRTRKIVQEREAEVRRRIFRRLLLRSRYTLERTPHDRPDEVWSVYTNLAPELLAEAALVEGDFLPSDEFLIVVRRAGELRRDDAEKEARVSGGKVLRDVLKEAICAVYDFTDRK